jgi:prolyl oligopeptidase
MPMKSALNPGVDEVLHGAVVFDPYRWLEDRNSPETEEWMREQSARHEAYFSGCDGLEGLRSRVEHFLNVPVVDQPARIGNRYFYRRRNRDQEQPCIYVRDAVANSERLLIDPSGQGRFTSVEIHRVSDDASLLAYSVRHGGTDMTQIRVVDVATGQTLPALIENGHARGFVFVSTGDGFYFSHESQDQDKDLSIRFRSCTQLTEDRVVFARRRTPRGRLILIADSVQLGAIWIHEHETELVCDLWVAPRSRDNGWRAVFANRPLPCSPILHQGRIFVLSFENAPNGTLIELTSDGRKEHAVVPERKISPRQVAVINDSFFVCYWESGRSTIRNWTLEGECLGELELPTNGTVQLLPQRGLREQSLFYSHESFASPTSIYELAPEARVSSLWSARPSPLRHEEIHTITRRFQAKDGTEIPITLVARMGIDISSSHPLLMTSYGGFGIPALPKFSALVAIMIGLGVVFAIPRIRGGGDFGNQWHEAALGKRRQTAFDDFIAATEWLYTQGIASPRRIAIFGGSNSGLLVGVAMTQRPELYRAVLSIAPLLDMVRYEQFDQAAKWRREYGSVENREEFEALHAYSPYHNLQSDIDYPSTLFVAGDRDDRCNPAHVRKMAAALQAREAQHNPILVDYSAERGHAPAMPLTARVDALARRLAFLARELGMAVPTEARDETADW